MTVKDMAVISGYSGQWLNELERRNGIPGVKRKPNGRMKVAEPERAKEWCEKAAKARGGGNRVKTVAANFSTVGADFCAKRCKCSQARIPHPKAKAKTCKRAKNALFEL